jgi:DNA invertase Pin-like site-specific DNA recombinase
MSPKKIALPLDVYVRVSDVRGRGGDSFISPKEQEERCRALAAARAFKVGLVFSDMDVSGGKMRRPELDKAIARIAEGVSGGIIVAKLDRFARTLVGGLQTLEQINELGGAVVVADGEFDTSTATGELVLNMMLSLAQFELRRIKETWATSKRHAVENGIHVTRHAPPGYLKGADRRLTLDPQSSDAVREAFAMAAQGEPYARIADHLTERRVPSGGNAESYWQSYRIKRLLSNRAYLGEARSGHGDVNPDAHPALVDEITWNLAQRAAPIARTLTKTSENLLSGIARCASCSFAMRTGRASSSATVPVYRCVTTTTHGRCKHPTTISAKRFEDYVLERFLEAAGTTTFRPVEEEAADLGEAIVAAERSFRSALTDVALRQQIGDANHSQMVAQLHRQWEDLLAEAPAPSPQRPPLGEAVDLRGLVEELRERGETSELRSILGAAIAAAFVRPAASRARGLPVEDRVKIVFHGSETLTLPKRGELFEPRAYQW